MPYKNYTSENLSHALASVRSNEMTAYKASKMYKVPYQTLLDKLKHKHTNPSGHTTVLTKEEEQLIVKWIHHMAEIGFPVTKEQLLNSVSKLVKELNRPNPFKDGIPGRHWYDGFLKRNPNITSRVCQALTTAREAATEQKIRNWFDRVYNYLEENNYLEILQDPSRIFNCDESAFFFCPKGQAVLARKGQKSIYCRSGNDEKENLTLCLGASADGKLMPILALFPYKRIPMHILTKYPKTWVIGRSDNGWMTCQTFYEYIANSFNGFLLKENIKKPVLLFLDGHVSHLSLPLTTFCKENGIILVALLPNSSHALQPMDVAVFHALKNSWKKSIHDWRMANNAKKLGREDFGPILEGCIQKTLKPEIIQNGFRHAGLFPFDQNAVNYDKLVKSSKLSDAGSSSSSDVSTLFTDEDETNERILEKTLCPAHSEHFAAQFEKLLGEEKLKVFKECDGAWQGEIKDFSLFYFWKNISTCSNNEVNIGDITLKANDCTLSNIEENIMDFDKYNILEGVVEDNETVLLTLPLTPSLQTKGDEVDDSDDENLSFKNFNPNLKTSTPSTKSKEVPDIQVKTYRSNDTTPPAQRCREVNEQKQSMSDSNNTLQFPTPFKNSLLWPETDISKNTTKKIRKSLIPTIATSTEYMNYQQRLDQEKKQKIETAELRKKQREEKAKAKLNKIKDTDKKDKKKSKRTGCSSATSLEDEHITENMNENMPAEEIPLKTGDYVVVKYDSKHFPGIVTKVSEDTPKTFDVKTMTMSGLDTITGRVNWRWPEKDDILTYYYEDVIRKIKPPIPLNKRGVFSVVDM